MEIKEKQVVVSIVSGILIIVLYAMYLYKNYIALDYALLNDFKFWGKAFLVLIPISIVVQIIIHIIFAIINKIVTNEDMDTKTDERDKLIELKTIRISHWLFILGFVLAMASQAMGYEPWVFFVTLLSSGLVASVVSEAFKLYFYRKGC